MAEQTKVDVLAVMADAARYEAKAGAAPEWIAELREARAAVASLIEAATRANGEHSVPHDCYATGPLTGDVYRDLVSCPGCELAAALANIGPQA